MYHGFDFSDGVGIDIQQTVDYGQFILGLRALPYPNFVTVDGFHLSSHHDLCLGYPHDLIPPDVRVILHLQPVFGDGDNPVGQHGQVQVSLDATVCLVEHRAYVQVRF